jgi:hypothetical protein
MKRTILSILAGLVTIDVLALGGDYLTRMLAPGAFDANGFSQNTTVLLAALAYSIVFSAFGGWVTGTLSRRPDRRDVLILAGFQFALTLAANIMLSAATPLWYHIATVLAPAAIIVGGRMVAPAGSAPKNSVTA